MPLPTTPDERLALINENLAELLNPEIIKKVLDEGKNPKIYWGTATTGRPHTGYLVPAIKIAQLLAAGCEVTVLLADIHGFLDNLKAPIELVESRAVYYKFVITALLKAVGVSVDKLKFVFGSSYQKSPEYVMDVYKMSSLISEHHAKRAGAEVVKQSDDAPLSGLLYPVLQVLDEQYLDVDAQLGGMDQRKLFVAATEWLPKIGYRQRAHLINPMVAGLQGAKMSSSDENSKIDLLDSADQILKKVKKAFAAPKEIEGNGVLALIEYVLLPASELKTGERKFVVERERDGLEPLVYNNIKQIHEDYANDILTPQLIKAPVAKGLNEIMAPIFEEFTNSKEWQEITEKAYPPPPVAEKKKKPKNKGTGHPGLKKQQENADPQQKGVEDGVKDLAVEDPNQKPKPKPKDLPRKPRKEIAHMKDPAKVYILFYTDVDNGLATSVLGVFASLQDANDECMSQARAAGITLESESSTLGPTMELIAPVQPARWDTPEGTSCWVECFDVTPKRVLSPD